MALNKRVIDIPINGGLNQLQNNKLLSPPNLLTLENGRYLKEGGIDKQFGYTRLSTASDPTAIATWRDELLRFQSSTLSTYSDVSNTWVDKGYAPVAKLHLDRANGSPVSASGVDTIVQDDVIVTTWLENTTYYYNVKDALTGAQVVSATSFQTSASACYPRLASIPGYIIIFWNSSGDLKYLRISTSTYATSSGTLYSTMNTTGQFDVSSYGNYIYTGFIQAATGVRISKVDLDLNVVATNTIAGILADSAPQFMIDAAGGHYIYVAGFAAGSTKYAVNLLSDLSASTAATALSIGGVTPVNGAWSAATPGTLYYTVSNATTSKYYLCSVTAPGTGAVIMRSVGLASRPTKVYVPQTLAYSDYYVVLHDSTLQATYFLIGDYGMPVAKFCPGESGTHATVRRPSNFSMDSSSAAYVGILRKGRIQSENATLFAVLHPHVGSVEFDSSYITLPMTSGMLIAGGLARNYDGTSIIEYGLNLYPEDISVAYSNTGPGAIPNGVYLIYVLYEWTDAQGVRHQSAPSVAVTATLSGADDTITVTVPLLRVTAKTSENVSLSARSNILIKAFMTTDAGTIPYYAGSATNTGITSSDTTTITLTAAPSTLTSNEILYTTGGELENIAAPSHGYAFTHNNRIVILDLEDPYQVRFSKELRPLTGAGFHEDLSINYDPVGGRFIAGGSLNGAMVLFKETAIIVQPGDFPNDLGQSSALGTPVVISSIIGCRDPKSVLVLADAIYFMSSQGLYRVTSEFKLEYIGGPVKDYESDTIISSQALRDRHEIRFLTDANRALCYNTLYGRWSTLTTRHAIDAVVWRDNTYVYATDSKILAEDSSTWLNDGSYVQMRIRTSWISFGHLQGLQRVYRLGLLGTYYTNNAFSIKLYYDYSDTVRETEVITASDLVNTSVYGDGVYGSEAYYGGTDDEVYQLRKHLARQKCQAISIELVDAPIGAANTGHGFSLEGISLEVAGKGGIFRNSSTRTF